METYVLRLWLPDRPGALGAVASRIGAVKGDVVGIEILETGQGQAVDELVVQLPDSTLVDLLIGEVRQVDGVEVEEVRRLGSARYDRLSDTLETAAALVAAVDREAVLATVRDQVGEAVAASWVAVVDRQAAITLVAGEGAPSAAWLAAFGHGAESAGELSGRPVDEGDVVWTPVDGTDLALVAGRDRLAWRSQERRQLVALARILGVRWNELADGPR